MTKTRLVRRWLFAGVGLLLLIQLIPYGHTTTNPPVTQTVRWDSPQTARLFAKGCQDCHSNLTTYHWYNRIAPASWLVQHDIEDGRARLNVSEWNKPQTDIGEVVDAIRGGGMPPIQYKIIHAASRLSSAQRDALARGMIATYRKDPPKISAGGGG